MKNFVKLFSFLFVFAALFVSCSEDESTGGTSSISVKMVDAPGDYAQVLVDVQGIEVNVDGEFVLLTPFQAGVYDLLQLTGGNFAALVQTEIPSGNVTQMRLILGTNNTLVLNDGTSVALETPSAQQTGLKLNIDYNLEAGIEYNFILDFEVANSIVESGNGGFILKPVIRITTEAESGAIAGSVSPSSEPTQITATNVLTNEVIVTNSNPEDGSFLLYGVPEGTYLVTLESSTLLSASVPSVVVTTGVTTELGVIVLL